MLKTDVFVWLTVNCIKGLKKIFGNKDIWRCWKSIYLTSNGKAEGVNDNVNVIIVTNVFINSLCNLFNNRLCDRGERKLEFCTKMPCLSIQFCYSKVLRSESRNSTTAKAKLLCMVPGSPYSSKILQIVQFIAYSASFGDYFFLHFPCNRYHLIDTIW